MSLFQLFYLYSSTENYCFHSDWLLGYILDTYVINEEEESVSLLPIASYPSCGNYTSIPNSDGELEESVRLCTLGDVTCHKLEPVHMEYMALNSFVTGGDGEFDSIPLLEGTEMERGDEMMKELVVSLYCLGELWLRVVVYVLNLNVFLPLPFSQYQQQMKNAPKKYAYVTVLGWNPDQEQHNIYIDAVRILLASLKSSQVADFVVLMTYDDESTKDLLESEGATVTRVDRINYGNKAAEFEPWFVDIAFAKLRAFELTKYERIQVVDADSIVMNVGAMDELFTSYPKSKLVAEGLGTDSPLRAGWLLIEPSTDDFLSMQEIIHRGEFDSELGWDYSELDVEYPGWEKNEEDAMWTFYGAQLEQGEYMPM